MANPGNDTSSAGPVVVALGFDACGSDLVRAAFALARESGSELDCVTVETGRVATQEEGEFMTEAQRLARSLGARIASVVDLDPAAGLLKYAAGRGASALVLGAGRRRLFGRTLADRLRSAKPGFGVVAVTPASPRPGRSRRGGAAPFEDLAGQYSAALLVVAAMTGINLALASYAGYWSAAITYLAAISISAIFFDRGPVIFAALLSGLAWDFFFIPPRFTMVISRTEDLLMLGLYLVVAACSGWMTGRLRASERLLSAREARLSRLSSLASELAGAKSIELILDKSMAAIQETFGAETIVILRDTKGSLKTEAESGWEPLDATAREAARLCFEGLRSAGRFTDLATASEWHFVPMEGPRGCLGVIGLRSAHDASWTEDLESFLRTLALTVSIAAARELTEG
jgi:two-component system sensor histidine kinase KdpD